MSTRSKRAVDSGLVEPDATRTRRFARERVVPRWGVPRASVTRIEDSARLLGSGPNLREFFMIVFVEHGGGRHSIAGAEHETAAGDLYVIAPDEVHDGRRLGATEGWVLTFMPDALLPDAPSPGYVPLPGDPRWLTTVRTGSRGEQRHVIPDAERPRWSRRFAEIAAELSERPFGFQQAVRAQLALLLVDTTRLVLPDPRTERLPTDLVQEMMEVIDARYADDIPVSEVARALGRSPSHLGRVVKRATGATVGHWIEERRMLEARRLLLETGHTIDVVARSVGYADAKYFSRRFRKVHGIPAQRWRERNR
jgi:AraC-like DNA-binding protein